MTVDPYAPTPAHNQVLPRLKLVCPYCGCVLPPIAHAAPGAEAIVSKNPGRMAETVRIPRQRDDPRDPPPIVVASP